MIQRGAPICRVETDSLGGWFADVGKASPSADLS